MVSSATVQPPVCVRGVVVLCGARAKRWRLRLRRARRTARTLATGVLGTIGRGDALGFLTLGRRERVARF